MTSIELELTEHDLLTLKTVASIGPSEQVGVIKASVLEHGAIDWNLGPDLAICVVSLVRVIALLLLIGLLPLVHLNFPFESITVLSDDTEVAIAQIDMIFRDACKVNKLVHILALCTVDVADDAGLLRS